VEQLFSSRLFYVPDYQRGYAWEEDQLNDFIEDIAQLPSGRDHYTGTVVLLEAGPEQARADASGSHFSTADVVDGQQRLTTIVLFLEAIRREMAAVPWLNQLAEGIRQNYIACTDEAGQPMYKLTLNRDCRDYFIESVLSDTPAPAGPTIESHRRLSHAKTFFASHLQEKRNELGAGYEKWLKELRNKLVLRLKMTLYTVNDEADVGMIFEVLNDRGKHLSPSWKGQKLSSVCGVEAPGTMQAIASFLPLTDAARFRSTSGSDYLALVQLCEKYAFRVFRLRERRAHTGQSSLFHVARRLYGDGLPPEEKLSMEGTLAQVRGYLLYYCSDNDFRHSFMLHDENDWHAWYGIKYFLYEYEEELAGGRPINRKWGEVEALDRERTIEHILPQTPDDPYWTERFNPQVVLDAGKHYARLSSTVDRRGVPVLLASWNRGSGRNHRLTPLGFVKRESVTCWRNRRVKLCTSNYMTCECHSDSYYRFLHDDYMKQQAGEAAYGG